MVLLVFWWKNIVWGGFSQQKLDSERFLPLYLLSWRRNIISDIINIFCKLSRNIIIISRGIFCQSDFWLFKTCPRSCSGSVRFWLSACCVFAQLFAAHFLKQVDGRTTQFSEKSRSKRGSATDFGRGSRAFMTHLAEVVALSSSGACGAIILSRFAISTLNYGCRWNISTAYTQPTSISAT